MGKVLKVREVGDPILEKQCNEVNIKNINEDIIDIIEDLKSTLEYGTGLGIAAPQIGVDKRIIVVGAKKENIKYNDAEEIPITAMINPTWKKLSEDTDVQYEGCMSVPSIRGADIEIVELGALLHDIAMPSEYGEREQHHIYGAEIAEQLLTELNYPKERIEQVKNCVLNHRGSKDRPRNTIEEQCVADADVIAHFDCIPSLFSLVYKEMNLSISDGKE